MYNKKLNVLQQKTSVLTTEEYNKTLKTFLIDGSDLIFGRLASIVSLLLQNKYSSVLHNHYVQNNNIILYNMRRIKLTGKKLQTKIWYFPYNHGVKKVFLQSDLSNLCTLFKKTVFGMLPKNLLRKARLENLLVILDNFTKNYEISNSMKILLGTKKHVIINQVKIT